MTGPGAADVVVVGAGIVGLGLALQAIDAGLSVIVVERDDHAVGASVRNFGHVGTTGQSGVALDYALAARETWLRVAGASGAWLRSAGTVVVARADDELATLAEFADRRGAARVRLLTAAEVDGRTGIGSSIGGALLPLDLRVDARAAIPAVTAWLAARGVRFLWSTAVTAVENGRVDTTRGTIGADRVFVAVGHDVDRFFPDAADDAGLVRCALHMLAVDAPGGGRLDPAVLTGHSLLRYGGFLECPSAELVRARLMREQPATIEAGLNLMFTPRPDGSLVIGDTHAYARTHDPFDDEAGYRLVLDETARLLGVPQLAVRQRWRGVYASAREPYLRHSPAPGVHVASVTSGIGMTTAFGFTAAVFAESGSPSANRSSAAVHN
ncbi:MAG: TIGR03364 family FAD-dependent oxidoreductase [Jatrophihabitans sp.]|uniref:TIGR03364 family FAD-dependent oxidoreductase n=1 Tax=Jatrophihabitans sp. TaxID=1932789 RepID=UPI003F7CEEB1